MKLWAVFHLTWVFLNVQAWIPSSRLQRDSVPISYNLKLIPHIKNDTYYGEVTILIQTKQSIENITLNSKSLNITDVTLDQAIRQTKYYIDPHLELLHVSYEDQRYVDPGEHILNIKFRGNLQKSYGFYARSDYSDNNTRKFLATKFSPTHAREAFPCYDEPYFKSIFNIRLYKPDESWTALSNMEEMGQVKTPNGIAVDFRSTIPISTYLLAWFLVDFNSDEIIYKGPERNISLRFFTTNGEVSDRKAALETTRKALEFFENYTGILYPLSKLDSIEVPYYRSGGMEHWGMIAYRASSVIYNPTRYLSKLQHWIWATHLMTHEISHMWFGNLVSHEWYNDLWLTEGFARFMQYKASFSIIGEPFANMLFQNDKFTGLFDMHCRGYSVETASYVRSLYDIRMKYGSSTYDQGGAILQMLEDVIGRENFQEAVRKHLNSHEYSIATTAGFINTVQDVVPKINIRDFMITYLFQTNLPLIKVTKDMDHYILHQEPFCVNSESSVFGSKWTVPIKYITNGNKTSGTVWFDRDMDNVTIPKTEKGSWIIVNHGYTGLFRTIYSREIYNELREHFKELHIYDRGFLIGETFHLTDYQNLTCDIPLQLLGEMQYIEDIDYVTFDHVSKSFNNFVRMHVSEEDILYTLKSYFFNIFEALYHNVTWNVAENESIDHRLLRQSVLDSFCNNGVRYMGCYKDVKSITKQNFTVHDDVKYVYDGVYEYINQNKTETEDDEKNNLVNNSMFFNIEPSIHEYEQNCSVWIRRKLEKTPELAARVLAT